MKITVKVDPDLCIGAASCVTVDPSTFVMNNENKAEVLDHNQDFGAPAYEREMEVSESELETIVLAAQSCPTMAIFVTSEEGQLYPEI